MTKNRISFLLFICLLLLTSCNKVEQTQKIDKLKISVLPVQDIKILHEKYQPLASYLEKSTQIETQLIIANTYQQMMSWLQQGQVDLVLLGGVSYILAHHRFNIEPLVMRNENGEFQSVALVSADNPANSLQQLNASSVAFGPRLSTSGHMIPRHFLHQLKIAPETFFTEIHHTFAHDETARWVQEKRVDVGFVNSNVFLNMVSNGQLDLSQVKVLWDSPLFVDFVWGVRAEIDNTQKNNIRNAFLQLSSLEDGSSVISRLDTDYYIPASHADFIELEETVVSYPELMK